MTVQLQALFKFCVGLGVRSTFLHSSFTTRNSPGTYIVIIFMFITFIQDIYNYTPKTNHVSTVYSVAALLYSQFYLHVITHVTRVAYLSTSTFCSTCAAHSMTVFCSSWRRAPPVCCSDIFWWIVRWFQLLPLLLVSLLIYTTHMLYF